MKILPEFDVGIIYGDDGSKLVKKLMNEYGVAAALAGHKNDTVGIKPNLVVADPAEEGATTDPRIIAGIIEFLQEMGINDIKIMESSWTGGNTRTAFRECGYNQLGEEYGVEIIDLKQDRAKNIAVADENFKVCRQVLAVDYLINVPVLKAHCQTKMTCALKNLKGCIPDSEKRRYHREGLHKPIALLNKVLRPNLIIVDGIYGDLTFEEGGNPVKMDRLIIGKDPVLIDSYAARLLGYEIGTIDYIGYAADYGLGSIDIEAADIRELNSPGNISQPAGQLSRVTSKLADYIDDRSACSACYGNLMHALYRLQESGNLSRLPDKVKIGQEFEGKEEKGPGIGKCTRKFDSSLAGCPAPTDKIISYLKEFI